MQLNRKEIIQTSRALMEEETSWFWRHHTAGCLMKKNRELSSWIPSYSVIWGVSLLHRSPSCFLSSCYLKQTNEYLKICLVCGGFWGLFIEFSALLATNCQQSWTHLIWLHFVPISTLASAEPGIYVLSQNFKCPFKWCSKLEQPAVISVLLCWLQEWVRAPKLLSLWSFLYPLQFAQAHPA